ncbi:MAG TPA: hypothetical protein VI056_00780 [Candidatus Limnocylindria bacterium]
MRPSKVASTSSTPRSRSRSLFRSRIPRSGSAAWDRSSPFRVVAKHADVWNSNAPTPQDTVALTKLLDEHCAKVGRDPTTIRRSSQLRADNEDAILTIAETTVRAGFTELLLFPFAGGGDLRSGVERAARLLPRLRALAR